MRKRSSSDPGTLELGLALSAILLGGYQLYRSASPRTRTIVGAGLVAGLGVLLWNRRREARAGRASGARPSVTQATIPATPADMPIGEPGRNLEERLDEAIHETFPASDPISVRIE